MNKTIEKFKEKHKDESEIDQVVAFLESEYWNKKSINFNYEQALEKSNIWIQRLNKKNKYLKYSGQVDIIKEFENGFKIVRLIDQESKDWEGFHMGHCVASYTDHQGIYSLRDNENFPHCTIEIENRKIRQIKGKGNEKASPKYVNYVLDFIESINFKHDIEDLGYIKEFDLEFIKGHFSNFKIVNIKDEEFLYIGDLLPYDSELIITLLYEKQGHRVEQLDSKIDNFGISHIVHLNNDVKVAIMTRCQTNEKKITGKHVDKLKKAMDSYECLKGVIYTTPSDLPNSLYKISTELGIEIVDRYEMIKELIKLDGKI